MHNQQTRQKMFALIQEWQLSELDQASFCKIKGISIHILHYWQKQLKAGQKPTGTAFIPVTVPTKEKATINIGIEILYPNGVRIVLPKNSDVSMVSTFINMV